MAKKTVWQDDYWLMLMQAYLQKPEGPKPLYSRTMVNLSLELHIPPQALQARMLQLSQLDKPRIERLWNTYGNAPKKLERAVKLLRQMKGFGAANDFYDGVEVEETFERDFRPIVEPATDGAESSLDERITPMMLIIILDLYFQLTPATMVATTPEVQQLAKLMRLKSAEVVQVLDTFQYCDPYLNRGGVIVTPLLSACQQVWQRLGNHDQEELAAYANDLKAYFAPRNE